IAVRSESFVFAPAVSTLGFDSAQIARSTPASAWARACSPRLRFAVIIGSEDVNPRQASVSPVRIVITLSARGSATPRSAPSACPGRRRAMVWVSLEVPEAYRGRHLGRRLGQSGRQPRVVAGLDGDVDSVDVGGGADRAGEGGIVDVAIGEQGQL